MKTTYYITPLHTLDSDECLVCLLDTEGFICDDVNKFSFLYVDFYMFHMTTRHFHGTKAMLVCCI